MKELEYKKLSSKKAKDSKDYEEILLEMLANDFGYAIDNPNSEIK